MIGMVKMPGGVVRATLELPWFCVWVDIDPWVIESYRRDRPELAIMFVHELEDAAFRAIRDDVKRALGMARDAETAFTIPSTRIPREQFQTFQGGPGVCSLCGSNTCNGRCFK